MKQALIITSISHPNAVMKSIAVEAGKNNVDFIVIGDTKSPSDFSLDGCRFYSIAEQSQLSFSIASILPQKHYARKNIGYLLAKDHDIIIETDDDNFPRAEFWNAREKNIEAKLITGGGWSNVYSYFSKSDIWPRGFPLEFLSEKTDYSSAKELNVTVPIQQGLADENPDVDAVYRMCRTLPIDFEKKSPIALGKNTWCPFNSQNTTWFKEAFALLYLPSYCSFRMTDIWRSFIAQRIAWTCGWPILFHQSTVWQERNEHVLLKDFEDEIPGYLNNAKICKLLEELPLKEGSDYIYENLHRCYSMLTEKYFIGRNEMPLVEAWINDMSQ
jgi:hypothetical protein